MLGPRRLAFFPQCVLPNLTLAFTPRQGQLSSQYSVLSEFSIADSAYVNTGQQAIEKVIGTGNTEVGFRLRT